MSEGPGVRVNETLLIPGDELAFRATRSGGPGGQHVNKTATRIELTWNVDRSRVLDDELRVRLRTKLGTRVDSQGNVRVVSSAHRSQLRNRDAAVERLAVLVRRALEVPRTRKATRPGRPAIESRLDAKRRQRAKKERRRWKDDG